VPFPLVLAFSSSTALTPPLQNRVIGLARLHLRQHFIKRFFGPTLPSRPVFHGAIHTVCLNTISDAIQFHFVQLICRNLCVPSGFPFLSEASFFLSACPLPASLDET
jgi:hypothetical protein